MRCVVSQSGVGYGSVVEEDYPLHAHTRDFLDKLKAKNRKTNAPMEIGTTRHCLPCSRSKR